MQDIEAIAWLNAHPDDLWVFDKLILARKLGYVCGPAGVDVLQPNWYIVRPCVNIPGMGRGARFEYLYDKTDYLPYGHFWCETFRGPHISVDYRDGKQVLAVEGMRISSELWKFAEWRKTDVQIEPPELLKDILNRYPVVNIEYIGGKVIEVHFRHNPDFKYGNSIAVPVWEGQSIHTPDGMDFVYDPEYKRIGFYIDTPSSQAKSSDQ